jgi:hypothetical protein
MGLNDISRKSTQVSEQGTPITSDPMKLMKRSGSAKYRKSVDGMKKSDSSIFQEASEEAFILSLDPKATLKKKAGIPRQLKPIKKNFKNMAADVLADLEKRDNNRDKNNAMRDLDREINGYLNFDTKNIHSQMNNAFEGTKMEKEKR